MTMKMLGNYCCICSHAEIENDQSLQCRSLLIFSPLLIIHNLNPIGKCCGGGLGCVHHTYIVEAVADGTRLCLVSISASICTDRLRTSSRLSLVAGMRGRAP
jgi:hypothetical protein